MYKKWLFSGFLASCLLSPTAFALQISSPISIPVQTTQAATSSSNVHALEKKLVTVLKMHLSPIEWAQLKKALTAPNLDIATNSVKIAPNRIDLGMNGVPVLDQGAHGTCVTFATTAAIDAILGKGDYVSQLCSLELGSHLEKRSDMPSGWDGSFGPWVFDQINRFGVISKIDQQQKSCAGVKAYPVDDPANEGHPMTLEQYASLSKPINDSIYSLGILNAAAAAGHIGDVIEGEKALKQVKSFLNQGTRLTFGTLLVLTPYCNAGACASYHSQDDTWAITPEIEHPGSDDLAGHEMLIIGYDDQAIAVDHEGKKHQGLLILRNSWGSDVGDKGNYYMTYDYFENFVDEVQAIAAVTQFK